MANANGFDLSRPAAAWVKQPLAPAARNSNQPPKLSAPAVQEPKRHQWLSAPVSPLHTAVGEPLWQSAAIGRPVAGSPRALVKGLSFGIQGLRLPRSVRYRAENLVAAGIVFMASAIAVLAIAALVFPRPLGAMEEGSPEVGSVVQAAIAPGQDETDGSGDSPVSPAVVPAFPATGDSTEPASLGSIRIPTIGLDAKYYSGVHDAVVALGPGLWPGTPLPGVAGNSVFAGHRTTHTHPFEDLDLLKPGDLIEVTRGSDAVTEFRVVSIETVGESQYVKYALAEPDSPEAVSLTLVACAPKGSRTHRIVVRASAGPAGSVPEGVMPKAAA